MERGCSSGSGCGSGCGCGCGRLRWQDVVALLCGCLNNATAFMVVLGLNTLLTDWRLSFQADVGATASVQAVCMGVITGGGLIAGMLERKLGQRRCMLLGSFLSSAGYFAGGFAETLPVLILCVGVIAGSGTSLVNLSNLSSTLQRFSRKAGFVASTMGLAAALVLLLSPFCIRYLTDAYTWRGCLFLAGGINLHAVLFSLLLTSPLLQTAKAPVAHSPAVSAAPLLQTAKAPVAHSPAVSAAPPLLLRQTGKAQNADSPAVSPLLQTAETSVANSPAVLLQTAKTSVENSPAVLLQTAKTSVENSPAVLLQTAKTSAANSPAVLLQTAKVSAANSPAAVPLLLQASEGQESEDVEASLQTWSCPCRHPDEEVLGGDGGVGKNSSSPCGFERVPGSALFNDDIQEGVRDHLKSAARSDNDHAEMSALNNLDCSSDPVTDHEEVATGYLMKNSAHTSDATFLPSDTVLSMNSDNSDDIVPHSDQEQTTNLKNSFLGETERKTLNEPKTGREKDGENATLKTQQKNVHIYQDPDRSVRLEIDTDSEEDKTPTPKSTQGGEDGNQSDSSVVEKSRNRRQDLEIATDSEEDKTPTLKSTHFYEDLHQSNSSVVEKSMTRRQVLDIETDSEDHETAALKSTRGGEDADQSSSDVVDTSKTGGQGGVRKWTHFLTRPLLLAVLLSSALKIGMSCALLFLILDYTRSRRWSQSDGLFLNFLFMTFNLVARALAMVICLHPKDCSLGISMAAGVIGGVTMCVLGQVTDYTLAAVCFSGLAMCYGWGITMYSPCVLRAARGKDYPLAVGLCLSLIGVGIVAFTRLAGFLVDVQGSYTLVTLLYGISMVLAEGNLFFVSRCYQNESNAPPKR